jgi:hypothetical protein
MAAMTAILRPLTTGELLDRTFNLYRGHLGLFLGIFALPHLIVFAFQCLGVAFERPGPVLANVFTQLPWIYGALLLSWILGAVSQGAAVVAVSQVHLEQPIGMVESFSLAKRQILGVIGLKLVTGMAAGAALLFLVVPGVFLFVMWALAVPAKILENKGVFDSMSRSSDLTQGRRWRIFVIGLLFFLLGVVVNQLLQWPIQLASGFSGNMMLQRVGVGWQVASLAATFISECLVGPLWAIAFTLVYYDERVRKEAFDLQLMMTTLDASALPASPAQAGA